MELIHNPKCFANHCTLFAIEPNFLSNMLRMIKAGLWQPKRKADEGDGDEENGVPGGIPNQNRKDAAAPYFGDVGYDMYKGGLCVISLNGPMMKTRSKFGGVSTIDARRALNYAAKDPACSCILLMIDSPGGTTSGTQELGETVKMVDAMKPVHAHIDDMGASAAYWIASQARQVTANATALVGCIGTYSVIEDSSKAAEMAGVEVHVLATGGVKGGSVEGAPVKQEVLDHWQSIVDESQKHFTAAVASGRNMSKKAVSELADGRVHLAEDAQALGLIDEVASSEDVAQKMIDKYGAKTAAAPKQRSRNMEADAILKTLE